MWHKPQLMLAIADLLLASAAAALVVAGLLWAIRLPLFPLREVVLLEAPREVKRAEIERALAAVRRGNFFSVDLDAARQTLERLPWVRRADVRRRWPGRLEVRLEEHRAVAHWGEGQAQLVNSFGEVFYAANTAALPTLSGPPGAAPEVLRRFEDFRQALAPIRRTPTQVALSPRLAWQIRLDDGMTIELGREQARAPLGQRLARFIAAYPGTVAGRSPRALAADLRYPNGFALRAAGPSGSDSKGKT